MLYLCDNCGEIVLDKLLILQLQKHFPHLQITVMVRGGEVLNDATMRDVRQIHLDEVCPCTSSQVPLAGCDLRHIGEDARALLASSDMIIAKGQALNPCMAVACQSIICFYANATTSANSSGCTI